MQEIRAVLEELHQWKARGLIRYVGATVHSRPLALELIGNGLVEVLMHRYNMAHRGAEEQVLPAACKAEIPVVAFTCTRWGSLLGEHPDWSGKVPRAADCYEYVLHHPAGRVALTAPETRVELRENLLLQGRGQLESAAQKLWEEYGALIYGDGRDAFETRWP